MRYPFRNIMTIVAKANSDFTTPTVVSDSDESRATTILDLATVDGQFSVYGTMDELLDFGSKIMQGAYTWAIVSGHSEWLGDDIQIGENGVISNGDRQAG